MIFRQLVNGVLQQAEVLPISLLAQLNPHRESNDENEGQDRQWHARSGGVCRPSLFLRGTHPRFGLRLQSCFLLHGSSRPLTEHRRSELKFLRIWNWRRNVLFWSQIRFRRSVVALGSFWRSSVTGISYNSESAVKTKHVALLGEMVSTTRTAATQKDFRSSLNWMETVNKEFYFLTL